jgi:hypothetical protein
MKIARKDNMLLAKDLQVFGHPAYYIMSLIDTYASIKVDRSLWLTDREKEFFVALIVCKNEGIQDFKSKEATEVFEYYFGKHRKDTRKLYVDKIEEKGWLKKVGGDIVLLDLFENIDLSKDEAIFQVRYKIVKDDN